MGGRASEKSKVRGLKYQENSSSVDWELDKLAMKTAKHAGSF